jgi:RNA polymerase sigma-70 factor (ECF subfamily)
MKSSRNPLRLPTIYQSQIGQQTGAGRQERMSNQRMTSESRPDVADKEAAAEAVAETIARVLAGENQLFHGLIRPLERSVFVMLFMLLRNESDAEDAAQEAFIKVYRNLHTFRGDAKFSTWVLSIARNEGLGVLRKRLSRPEQPLDPILEGVEAEDRGDFTPALLTDWREVPLEALERKELRECLCRAVLNLPPIYREVVQLRDIDELDVRETACVIGISPGSVKVRLHRARTMLQKELATVLKGYATPSGPSWRRLFGRHA